MKDENQKQWEYAGEVENEAKRKASLSSIKWGVCITVVILIAVFGVMWRGQDSLASKFSESEKKIMDKIECMNTDADKKRNETNAKLEALKEMQIELKTKVEHYLKNNKH